MAEAKELAELVVKIGADITELKTALVATQKHTKEVSKAVSGIGILGRKAMLQLASSSALANAYMNQLQSLVGMIADSFLSALSPAINPAMDKITEMALKLAEIPGYLDDIVIGEEEVTKETEEGTEKVKEQVSMWDVLLLAIEVTFKKLTEFNPVLVEIAETMEDRVVPAFKNSRGNIEDIVKKTKELKDAWAEAGEKIKDALRPGGISGTTSLFDQIKRGIGGI